MLLPTIQKVDENPSKTTEETISDSHLDMICNPAYRAFKEAVAALHKNPSLQIIEDIHTILLIDGSQQHTRILKLLPEIFPYIEKTEFYDAVALILCDCSHLNRQVCDDLIKFDIFDKLDYFKPISYNLVLSICDSNRDAWEVFRPHLKGKETNPKIQILIDRFEKD